jgi:hypothetical protein
MKWLEKLHVKEKKAQEKADAKVTKLEKAFKESQDQVDKNNKKVSDRPTLAHAAQNWKHHH